jgi:hypothetical protein
MNDTDNTRNPVIHPRPPGMEPSGADVPAAG